MNEYKLLQYISHNIPTCEAFFTDSSIIVPYLSVERSRLDPPKCINQLKKPVTVFCYHTTTTATTKLPESQRSTNMSASTGACHELLKPLSWLFGKWKSNEGKGKYPTISDFKYAEEAEFFPIGMKPMVQFYFTSWHPANETPMHRETGFIRLQPGTNKIAFVIAHNVGIVEVQEGEVKDEKLTVATTELGRASFNKSPAVKKLVRTLSRNGDRLEQVVDMETEKTGMTEHLRITFDKQVS